MAIRLGYSRGSGAATAGNFGPSKLLSAGLSAVGRREASRS